MSFFGNVCEALWLNHERAYPSQKVFVTKERKVHPVHYLLHLASGSLILALSVAIHLFVTDQIHNSPKRVVWQGGEVQTNYVSRGKVFAVHPNMQVEPGFAEDGTIVFRPR